MAQQIRKQPKAPEEAAEVPVEPKSDEKIKNDKRIADDLLDEIDSILEENAKAFVANYIQGGGE
jgi:ubiquitin-like protein Pup